MKKISLIITIMVVLLISSCNAPLSETALQTAVSEAIMTSAAGEVPAPDASTADEASVEMVSKQELENVQTMLEEANVELTTQAEKINQLQSELDQLYPLLTPSATIEPPSPTSTPASTPTPEPTSTETGNLLFNQKYVVTLGNIPIYTYEEENESGYPIMVKVDPIQKFTAGEKVIVSIYPVRADGGAIYYLVIGPQFGGYYILVSDVQDYTG